MAERGADAAPAQSAPDRGVVPERSGAAAWRDGLRSGSDPGGRAAELRACGVFAGAAGGVLDAPARHPRLHGGEGLGLQREDRAGGDAAYAEAEGRAGARRAVGDVETEQLVSRLEREGETVSSALEAARQAPWLDPDMAVTEKPALWPVLEDWRAHVQRAEEAGVPPFHLVGCDALVARMGALAEKDALPRALAEVLEEHRPFAEDRAVVSDWTSSMLETAGQRERMLAEAAAAGTAATSLPGHAAWSRRAEPALGEGVELLEDEGRYGVHLDRIAGARAQLGEPLGELGRALEFDGNAAWLQSEWRARERGEGDRSLEDFASRIAALARGVSILFLLIHESPLTDALFLLVSKSDEVTTT